MQGVAGAYHKLIACSWVPILQVGGLGKVRVNCFPKAITTWLGWESNPRPPDPESDALTTLPRRETKKTGEERERDEEEGREKEREREREGGGGVGEGWRAEKTGSQ